MWALIAGGGTGGHTEPALAIARALVDRGHPPDDIAFVGSSRGLEARLVPEAGFAITLLPGRGIVRRLSWANVGAVVGLVVAFFRAISVVARAKPSVVVSVGGYASVPCALAAVLWRVPIVVAEQNAVPGAANRLVARFAKASAVAFEDTPLPRAVVTGNPVREAVQDIDRSPAGRAAARSALGLPEGRTIIGAFGGSLGALRINRAVIGLARRWVDRGDLAVRHAIGRRDWPALQGEIPEPRPDGLSYTAVEYEDRMPLVLQAADVMVCRAGATTIAELTIAGVAAVLVPLPTAPGDHQTANARVLEQAGGAVIVPDSEFTDARLAAELDAIIGVPGRAEQMGKAAASLGRPDAAAAVADLVERHVRH